jgi:hypothetical protein
LSDLRKKNRFEKPTASSTRLFNDKNIGRKKFFGFKHPYDQVCPLQGVARHGS